MRTALVIGALIVPIIALALPDDATLSRLLVGTWHGHRHDTQYRADGTWILDPPDEAKPVGVGAASQQWILADERSSLRTRIAATVSVSLYGRTNC